MTRAIINAKDALMNKPISIDEHIRLLMVAMDNDMKLARTSKKAARRMLDGVSREAAFERLAALETKPARPALKSKRRAASSKTIKSA